MPSIRLLVTTNPVALSPSAECFNSLLTRVIRQSCAEYVSVRPELRRNVADVSYRIIHELARRTPAEWKILAEAELAWVDAEQAARDDVLAAIDCPDVQAAVQRALRSDLRASMFDAQHHLMRLNYERRYGTNAQP